MSTLVLTVVGADRAGLVSAVAEVVSRHGGNWETSELAEIAGTFAGVIQVGVVDARADDLREALSVLEGLVTVVVSGGSRSAASGQRLRVRVLGNDRPGIVRDITSVLAGAGLSIDRMATQTRDAAMSGGRLFDAAITAWVPEAADVDDVVSGLEGLAGDIQVDVSVAAEA